MAITIHLNFSNSDPGLSCLCVLNVPVLYVSVPCVQMCCVFVMSRTAQYVCSMCVNEWCVCAVNILCPCLECSFPSSLPSREFCSSAEVSHSCVQGWVVIWAPVHICQDRFSVDDDIWVENKLAKTLQSVMYRRKEGKQCLLILWPHFVQVSLPVPKLRCLTGSSGIAVIHSEVYRKCLHRTTLSHIVYIDN